MRYLTLEYIKEHSRIDNDCEDDLLDIYGTSAENSVLNLIGRPLEELKAAYGGVVPEDIIHATLILVENSIIHRSPSESQKRSLVVPGIDSLIKPFIVL